LLLAGNVGHFRVIERNELAHLRELVIVLLEEQTHLDYRGEMSQLASQRGHALGVLHRFWIGELPLDLAGPFDGLGEAISKAQLLFVAGVAPPLAYF
jgi:hypothetical protein